MKLTAKITDISTVNELDFYWKSNDYINLLKEFDYPDADPYREAVFNWLDRAVGDRNVLIFNGLDTYVDVCDAKSAGIVERDSRQLFLVQFFQHENFNIVLVL